MKREEQDNSNSRDENHNLSMKADATAFKRWMALYRARVYERYFPVEHHQEGRIKRLLE